MQLDDGKSHSNSWSETNYSQGSDETKHNKLHVIVQQNIKKDQKEKRRSSSEIGFVVTTSDRDAWKRISDSWKIYWS